MQKREYETLRNHIYKIPLNIRIICDVDYQNANVAEIISLFMSESSLQLKKQVLPFRHFSPYHKSVLSFESVNFAPFKPGNNSSTSPLSTDKQSKISRNISFIYRTTITLKRNE